MIHQKMWSAKKMVDPPDMVYLLVGGWTNSVEKYATVKLDHFPKFRGIIWNRHLVEIFLETSPSKTGKKPRLHKIIVDRTPDFSLKHGSDQNHQPTNSNLRPYLDVHGSDRN